MDATGYLNVLPGCTLPKGSANDLIVVIRELRLTEGSALWLRGCRQVFAVAQVYFLLGDLSKLACTVWLCDP